MGWRETVEAQPSEVHRKSQPIAQRPITSMRRPGLDDLPAFRVRFFAPIAIPLKYADIWWSSNPVLNPCLNSRSWRGRNHNISEGLRTSSMFNRLAIDATIPDRTWTSLPPFNLRMTHRPVKNATSRQGGGGTRCLRERARLNGAEGLLCHSGRGRWDREDCR